jgi:hypothetical protein
VTDRPTPGHRTAARALLIAATAVVLLAVAAGGVAAHDNVPAEPGASGHCADDGSGGEFNIHGPGDHETNLTNPAEVQSAVMMTMYFAQTQGECGADNETYLEAHVISADRNAQYCYGNRSDGDQNDTGRGDEPTDNTTAGAGLGEVNENEGSRNYPPGHARNENGEAECRYNDHNKPDREDDGHDEHDHDHDDTGGSEVTSD